MDHLHGSDRQERAIAVDVPFRPWYWWRVSPRSANAPRTVPENRRLTERPQQPEPAYGTRALESPTPEDRSRGHRHSHRVAHPSSRRTRSACLRGRDRAAIEPVFRRKGDEHPGGNSASIVGDRACCLSTSMRIRMRSWVAAHVAAFEFLDGVPDRLVPDSLATTHRTIRCVIETDRRRPGIRAAVAYAHPGPRVVDLIAMPGATATLQRASPRLPP